MRVGTRLILGLVCAASIVGATTAGAQTGPVIVVPGKPGMPVMIDGVIADGAIVYGDWGLARPNNAGLIIEGIVEPATAYDSRGYYPSAGRAPRLGRQEVEPPRRVRPRDTNFHREWGTSSDFRAPITEYPPFNPPEVITAPREQRQRPRFN